MIGLYLRRGFGFVEIGEFVCMPDHIHGILMIKSSLKPQSGIIVGTDYHPSDLEKQKISSDEKIQKSGSGKHILNDLDRTKNISSLHGSISGSLGSIIRGFKIGVTKFAKNNNIQFLWQSRFYDRIIKDEQEFQTIKKYIQDNPKNREKDEKYL